jgi:ribosomal protein S27AE
MPKINRIKPICSHCGSDDVTADALTRWNPNTDAWEVSNVLDNSDCEQCGGECNLIWVDADDEDKNAA